MIRSLALLLLLSSFVQDDAAKKAAEEKKKQEEKQKEEAAKKAIKEYKDEIAKLKNPTPQDRAAAVDNNLAAADPHVLIRKLLESILADPNIDVRTAAVEALGGAKWKGDKDAATTLLNCATNFKEEDLKVKCLRRCGKIAPYSFSSRMEPWFRNEKIACSVEAVDACLEINSVRVVDKLIALWGELNEIKDEKPGKDGNAPPTPGVPPAPPGANQQDERVKRKKDLMPRVISAVKDLWKKVDKEAKISTYAEAAKALAAHRAELPKFITQEDNEEKGLEPGDKKQP